MILSTEYRIQGIDIKLNMKDKNVAAIMALFLGGFGIHRFYLGQIGLGIFYCIFFWSPIPWILGLIDSIAFFSMDRDRFDIKYNRQYFKVEKRKRRDRETDFDRSRQRREREIEKWERRQRQRERYWENKENSREGRSSYKRNTPEYKRPEPRPKTNPYKLSGIKKYKDYDYDGAIEDFEKALEVDEKDIATHFNLACAYSLNENVTKSLYHLDKAIEYGFDDFKKIKSHDALAYIRIQKEFEVFESNGFRLIPQLEAPKEDLLSSSVDLLEQLKKLGELRDRGLLTEEEFTTQKKKLLR